MFGKKTDDGEGVRGDELNAFLGAGIEYRGRLEFVGTVRIDGRFHGEIVSPGTLVLGRDAEVHGQIRVGSLFSSGSIQGDVEAQVKTVLHGSAVLVGSLHSKALVIEEGARVEGQVSMQGEAAMLSARASAAALDRSAELPSGALPVEDEDAHLIEPLPAGEKTM
ncbi:polymer-forming cytoskeletal protein [Desulfovibrio aminophilus]|nr:polymer-forming cytoskeletal protein [Desulfovibrio aminophilus]MCM0754647.1 polymer-forming cytoskeletal protein [Desulfovibrio aminophilus]